MNAYQIPGSKFSLVSGDVVPFRRFVKCTAGSLGFVADAASPVVGASMNDVTRADMVLEVATGIVVVEASGPIVAGTNVYSDAEGKATSSGSEKAGIAMTDCAIAGEFVSVQI